MTLAEVIAEVEQDAAEARVRANNRVLITLRSNGWFTADDDAGLLWGHPKVHATLNIREAVEVQLTWDEKAGR